MSRRFPERLLLPRLAALVSAVPAARSGGDDGIHRARVASRRLREVVPVVDGEGPDARRARRAVRRVTRALGPVRELDVSLQVYAGLNLQPPLLAPADAAVRLALTRARARAFREASAAITPARMAALSSAIEALAAARVAMPRADVLAAVAARIARRTRALSRALDDAGTMYAPERLHAVRIAAKRLRYALEVGGDVRWGPTAARRRVLRGVQDLLGELHDLQVLASLVGEVETRLVTRSRAAARDLDRLVGHLDRRCRGLHARFVSGRSTLRTLAGQLGAVTGRQGGGRR